MIERSEIISMGLAVLCVGCLCVMEPRQQNTSNTGSSDTSNGLAVGSRDLAGCDCESCSFTEDSLHGWMIPQIGSDSDVHTVSRTDDGGVIWDSISAIEAFPVSISFADSLNGWIACRGGAILHTTDGGTTWDFQFVANNISWNTIEFVSRDTGFAGGYETGLTNTSSIVWTVDGGVRWKNYSLPYGSGCLDSLLSKRASPWGGFDHFHFFGHTGYAAASSYSHLTGMERDTFCLGDWRYVTDPRIANVRCRRCEYW